MYIAYFYTKTIEKLILHQPSNIVNEHLVNHFRAHEYIIYKQLVTFL